MVRMAADWVIALIAMEYEEQVCDMSQMSQSWVFLIDMAAALFRCREKVL